MPRGLHAKSVKNVSDIHEKQKILIAKYRKAFKATGRPFGYPEEALIGQLVGHELLVTDLNERRLAGEDIKIRDLNAAARIFRESYIALFPYGIAKPKAKKQLQSDEVESEW